MNSRFTHHGDGQSHGPPAACGLQVAHAIAELKLVRRKKSLVDMIPLRMVGDYGIMNGNNVITMEYLREEYRRMLMEYIILYYNH